MADTTNNMDGWQAAPQGAASLPTKMLINDASLQSTNPNWPTGGTAQQLKQESGYNPNAVSPTGALGMAQVEPSTLAAIEKQTGRKLNPNDIDDALFIHRYVMQQNLQHFGDVNSALAGYNGGWNRNNWNNPETQNYVQNFNAGTAPQDMTGWEAAPTQQAAPQGTGAPQGFSPKSDLDGWESAPQQPTTSAMGAFGRGAEQAALPTLGGLAAFPAGAAVGAAVGGPFAPVTGLVGGVAASMGAGYAVEKAQDYLLNQFPNVAKTLGLGKEQQQADVSQHPTASFLGQMAPQALAMRPSMAVNLGGRVLGGALGGGIQAAQEYAQNGQVDLSHVGLSALAGAALDRPTALGEKLGLHIPENVPADLNKKLQTGDWDQPGTESLPGEFVGPASPDQFGTAHTGETTPFYPEGTTEPLGTNEKNLRQMSFDFDNEPNTPPDLLIARENGDIGTPSQIRESQYPMDEMSKRVAEFNKLEPEQMDMFNELQQRRFDQMGPDEQPRTLSEDEFGQTLENLANTEGTRFDMPENIQEAYSKYLDTVADDQGGLFDRPTIAKNFIETAKNAAVERFVNDHPVVKANQAKVDAAQAQLETARDTQTRSMYQGILAKAQDLLKTSQENIGKFYSGDGRFGMYEKDGIIHMNSGVPIPDWIKNGLLKLLQGLHGVAVELIDKAFNKMRNLNSTAKIIQAGMRQAANEQRVKSVDTKVNEKQVDLIKKNVPGDGIKEFMPDDRPYAEAKPELAAAPDMDSSWITRNVTSQGGIWASAISKNPVVKWAFTHIQNALKEADDTSRRLLTNPKDGLRTLIQKMNSREKGEIHALMDMDEGETIRSDQELRQRGFNEKQRAYYQRFQQVMNEVYDRFNKAMTDAGLPPVDRRVAYMTSRFMGDFRSLVYAKGTTRPVGFIGGNTKFHVNGIKAKLEELHPGKYDFEPTTLNRGAGNRTGTDMFQGYLNVLNHFSMNDPEMKEIMDVYRQYFTSNATKAMGALQHAKDKQGVFGAEGRKAWQSQEQNAVEGMKSQLTYADHMIKWSAMQEAAGKVKEMMVDPDINQPNAKSYVKDYLANAMGQSTSKFAQGISDLLDGVAARTGIGPSVLRSLNSTQKSALLQLWLGFFRLPHALLTMTQFLQSNPAMARYVASKGEGDFWGNSMKGLGTTMQMALKALNPNHELTGFDKDIWDYNQKNQVFNANLTNHLADVNSTKAGRAFRHIMEANITYPEAAIRSSTFSIWAHALKEAGHSTKDALGISENLTRASLVDYRPSERPLVYGKMGMMGDIASTLTRFKMNQISQHQFFGKQALGKNVTPMAALLLSSIAFAGVSGLMGFNYADQAYQQITEHVLGKPDTLKAVMLRNLPDWANYGLMAQLGINMQGSFSNADTLPDNPLATLFPTGSTLVNMASSAGQALYYHDETTMKKLLYNASPTSAKGFEENTMFSKNAGNGNKLFINPNTEKAQTIRNSQQQLTRDLAFRPIAETRENDVIQASKSINDMYASLRERDLKRIEHQFAQGTQTPQDLANFRSDWVQHRGDASAATSIEDYIKNQRLTEAQRVELSKAQGNIQAQRSLQDIFAMGGTKR